MPGCTWVPVSYRITPWSSSEPTVDSMELYYTLRPFWSIQRWFVHTTKLSQPSCSPEFHPSLLWEAGLLSSFLYDKRSNSCVQLNFSVFLLVNQIPSWSSQLQFSWMKATSSFESLHNYLLQSHQIICLFLNLHHTKQKIKPCPGAVQKPWLREIADTKNDGHTHKIKSRIWLPIGQDLHKPLGHWPVLNSFWVSFLLGLGSRLKSCVNEKKQLTWLNQALNA